MPDRVSIRKLEPGSHVRQAFDSSDHLVLDDVLIQTEADINRLREQNVRYVILSDDQPRENNSESNTQPSSDERPDPSTSDVAQLEADDEFEEMIDLTEEIQNYENLLQSMETVFLDIHHGEADIESLQDLKPYINNFLRSLNKSPAYLSILTQLQDYDSTTFNHSINVCIFSLLYGNERGFEDDRLLNLAFGALIHDIGKTQLPRSLLNKKGALTPSEFAMIKRHPSEGRNLLKGEVAPEVWKICYEHHERPDGTGYPRGTREIDFNSKLVSVIDVYEALTAPRSYNSTLLPAKAFLVMKDEFYDDESTRAIWRNLLKCLGLFSIGSFVRLSNEMIGVVVENNPGDLEKPVVKVILDSNERPVGTPFEIDLMRIQHQKKLTHNHIFDDSIHIKEAMKIEQLKELRPIIEKVVHRQEVQQKTS